MKKLIMTIAIVLGLGMSTFAQEVEVVEERGLFGKGFGIFRGGDEGDPLMPVIPEMGENGDVDAPLGSGIALLMGLGGAYLVGKKRKKE